MAEGPNTVSEDDKTSRSETGYGKPPRSTRFQKGQSGNPRGRPRGRKSEIPHDHVLGQMVTVREDGRERRITAAEAFLLYLTRKALAGDGAAAGLSLTAIETARAKRPREEPPGRMMVHSVGMGIEGPLEDLGIGVLKYGHDESRARWELNPWIVEAALARLADRQLTVEEQREVYRTTRTPSKVTWPDWWTVRE